MSSSDLYDCPSDLDLLPLFHPSLDMDCRFVFPLAVPLHFLLDHTSGNLHFKNTSTAPIKYRKRRNVGMASKPSGCITAKSAVEKSVFVFFLPPLLLLV